MEDKQFTTQFMAIIACLVAFTIIIMVIANSLHGSDNRVSDARVQLHVAERIKPMGQVYVGEVPAGAGVVIASAGDVGGAAVMDLTGEEVYTQVCAACHTAGVLNAPITGDAASWEKHLAKGKETLYANAIGGINAMPAKGGRPDISDDDIIEAVDYMLP
ncbi:MAG: c-type cytochrome [Pseudomonadota bacterium]